METHKNIKKYQYLASKWLDKTITEKETKIFNAWYDGDIGKEVEIPDAFSHSEEELQARLLKNINSAIIKPKKRLLWPRISVAASILLLLSAAPYIYHLREPEQHKNIAESIDKNILPGKSGATLTLADGRQISLSAIDPGEFATENGTLISKTADGQLQYEALAAHNQGKGVNILSTSAGEMYTMTLPDKSKVWLNAATSLTFSSGFNDPKIREVKLEGEAYFEVAKDKNRPFVVTSDKLKVVVLGTHFNINTYTDEHYTETTLVEGSVEVTDLETEMIKTLEPSQQARIGKGKITIKAVNTEEMLAWKSGEFALGAENFETTLRKIERWYNVEFVYDSKTVKDIALDGWISRSSELSDVLQKIELGEKIKFETKGRRIFIRR